MDILVVTKNAGKLREINQILDNSKISINLKNLSEFDDVEIEETGKTFFENALLKAKICAEKFNICSIADDSGLEVDFLNGNPGVYSKRFAGENTSDAQNNELLLEKLKDVPFEKRTARFVCCVVLCKPNGEYIFGEGRLEGKITDNPSGSNGFGYDPLFVVKGKNTTLAQMFDNEKNQISHRKKALDSLTIQIKDFLKI